MTLANPVRGVGRAVDRALEAVERVLARFPAVSIAAIVLFYVFAKLADAMAVREYERLIFPSFVLYVAKRVLLAGGAINPALASTLVTPSAAVFIYPPGTYLLGFGLGTVRNMFWLTFVLEAFVPLLVFLLFRTVTSPLVATLCALVTVGYSIVIMFHPDYLMQPLLLLAVLLLWTPISAGRAIGAWHAGTAGALCGIVVALKHNIGIMFGIACAAVLLFGAIEARETTGRWPRRVYVALAVAYLGLGVVVALRLPHVDERVYFLLPYFSFWALVARHAAVARDMDVAIPRLSTSVLAFVGCAVVLPLILFVWVGSVVGFRRYVYSLFGMGFEFLHVWDYGILHLVGGYAGIRPPLSFRNVVRGFTVPALFALPWLVNLAAVGAAFRETRRAAPDIARLRKTLAAAALGIVGILLLFPLEDYRILRSKLFFFGFVALYLAGASLRRPSLAKKIVVVVLLVMLAAVRPPVSAAVAGFRHDLVRGTPEIESVIGLPVERALAGEIERGLGVIARSTHGAPFQAVDFEGEALLPFLLLAPNGGTQYYVDVRPEMLTPAVTATVEHSLRQVPYVVVRSDDYDASVTHRLDGTLGGELLGFVRRHFDVVGRYDAPSSQAPLGLYGFVVMKQATS